MKLMNYTLIIKRVEFIGISIKCYIPELVLIDKNLTLCGIHFPFDNS